MKQRYFWILKLTLSVIAAAVVIWFVRDAFLNQKPAEVPRVEVSTGEARVVFDYGEGVFVAGQIAASGTVLDATKAIAATNGLAFNIKVYSGMGTLVTQIGEKKNGEGGAYWQYWVNGTYATSSADNTAVHPGDRIEWKFTASAQ